MELKINEIKQGIYDICSHYQYEFNTQRVRNEMCYKISQLINEKVIDKTTPKMIDNNNFNFIVKVKDVEFSLGEYLEYMTIIYRKLKIEKIKKNIENYGKNN